MKAPTVRHSTLTQPLAAQLPWLDVTEIDKLSSLFQRREYAKDYTLLMEGALSQDVFIAESGALRLYFTRRDGRQFNKNFYAEGSIVLPITATMARKPSLFGIATMEKSKVWSAMHEQFKAALISFNKWHTVQRKLLAGMVDQK